MKEPSLSDLLDEGGAPDVKGAPSLGDPDEETPPDAGGDEAAEIEVGQKMLDAVKANDPKGMYEAMKACVGMS